MNDETSGAPSEEQEPQNPGEPETATPDNVGQEGADGGAEGETPVDPGESSDAPAEGGDSSESGSSESGGSKE
jgi:hypothetical protein